MINGGPVMLTLYIGNKNYSSWSLRAWFVLRQAGIPFEEKMVWFFDGMAALRQISPAGRVPVLVDDGLVVWDSLAISEYAAERFPDKHLWPAERKARARARSVCAEMHSGFGNLRNNMGMNIEASLPGVGWNLAVQDDIDRISYIITELRAEYAGTGPFLFGTFTIADAFFAPVASRFKTYAVKLPAVVQQWADTIHATAAMQQWTADALAEQRYVAQDEPYRLSPHA
jgi:glutathione S-transferase